MTLNNQSKLAKHILRLLKVNEIIFPIGRTSKGNFGIRYSTQSDDYELYLDAIPLSVSDKFKDENNIELKKMLDKYLFETAKVDSYAFMGDKAYISSGNDTRVVDMPVSQDKPKRGRPVGSKNGTRTNKEG